uniref:Peptidoglycan recognition protein 2 n=1 Tax=Sphenodon punctatus TaxID=8508 RepID=A0A8D0G5B2_SPHPU
MDSVIQLLDEVESRLEGSSNLTVTELSWALGCCGGEFHQLLLGPRPAAPPDLSFLSAEQRAFLSHIMEHRVDSSLTEHGVVLAPDGTTVAMRPVLAGIEAGLKRKREVTLPFPALLVSDRSNSTDPAAPIALDPLYAVTLAQDLGVAFLLSTANRSQAALGPNGCWDSISAPQNFRLMGPSSPLTDALVNGALDGVILGTYLAERAAPPARLSALLKDYYIGAGLAAQGQARSNFRRKNFAELLAHEGKLLREQVESTLHLLWELNQPLFQDVGNESFPDLASQAAKEFTAAYLECPAIIPRCMWEAKPYRGTPTQLKLPLGFVYIHHTHTPGEPCRSFPACAADMRSMQHFHQDVRGWDDIGYSFVVGADGYLYQGRGWHWVGAHTLGCNTKGYGVSFIGDYNTSLPMPFALELVRDTFMQCAVQGRRVRPDYIIHGHRQVVRTECPGNRLFQEIQSWPGFKVRGVSSVGPEQPAPWS